MLEIVNTTPYAAESALLTDLDCSDIWVVAVKATYILHDGETALGECQESIRLVDEYYGEPGISSLKYENELVFRKPGTDVIITGHAYAPEGIPVTQLDASVTLRGQSHTVRVYGDRYWRNSGVGLEMTDPEPFTRMPLLYERAFGGTDLSDQDPAKHGSEYRNPIGAGFAMSPSALSGRPLPNLEDPRDEIRNWKQRPAPLGFGCICKHWEPRRRYTGTCDQHYIENRLPFYPEDFDLRFFLGAHPGLILTPHLQGGEEVTLRGLTPSGFLRFRLPRVTLGFTTIIDGGRFNHRAILGTVLIEPDVPRLMMVWQSYLPCHRKKLALEETRIFEKERIGERDGE